MCKNTRGFVLKTHAESPSGTDNEHEASAFDDTVIPFDINLDDAATEGPSSEDIILFPPEEEPQLAGQRTRTVINFETGASYEEIEPEVCLDPPAPQPRPRLIEVRALLERPFFALARKPLPALPAYSDPRGQLHLHVTASDPVRGVATLQDADILIVLISLMNANRRPGEGVERNVTLPTATWLRLSGRHTGGRQHKLLEGALNRLCDTRITTNIAPNGAAGPKRTFSLLAEWVRSGPTSLTLTASDWLAEAVEAGAVLALSEHYLALVPGFERWLYRVARKHAGTQSNSFTMRISTLWKKSGATSPLPRFRFELKRIVEADRLPDYRLAWIEAGLAGEAAVKMWHELGSARWAAAVAQQEQKVALGECSTAPEEYITM